MKTIHHTPEDDHAQTHHQTEQGNHQHHHAGGFSTGLSAYTPLIALVGVSFAGALALSIGVNASSLAFMHFFMGLVLCLFSLVKLFDVKGFAKGFAKYDLLGAKNSTYATAYPFIELGLGCLYLSFLMPPLTYLLTIVLLGFGAAGVIKAMIDKKELTCACMGSTLNVPLSRVTLVEDIGMAAMAAAMLLM